MTTATGPTRHGTTLAASLYVLSLAALTVYTGFYQVLTVAALGGALFGISGLISTRKSTVAISLSSVLFICAALALVVASASAAEIPTGQFNPAESPEQFRPFILLLSVFCTATGATVMTRQHRSKQIARGLTATGGLICLLLGTMLTLELTSFPLLGWLGGHIFNRLITPTASADTPGSLLLLLGVSVIMTGAVLTRLPLPELVSREERPKMVTRLTSTSTVLFILGFILSIAGTVLFLALPPLSDTAPPSAMDSIISLSTMSPARYILLGVVSVAAVVVCLVEATRRVQPESIREIRPAIAHSTGAIILVLGGLVIGFDTIVDFISQTLTQTAGEDAGLLTNLTTEIGAIALLVGVVFTSCALLVGLVLGGSLLAYSDIIVTQTAGSALATSSVILAAIVSGLISGVSVLPFGVVGIALVGWDVSTYSHRLAIEVGHGSRKLELFHLGVTAFVTLASVSLVYGGLLITEAVIPHSSAIATVAALASILLLLSTLQA
jgi:hypothetical protein